MQSRLSSTARQSTALPRTASSLPARQPTWTRRRTPYAIMAAGVLELLGGADNIVDVTNCVTRLRVNVKDETLVADDPDFKSIGTSGIAKNGKGMQVIIGLKVPKVRDRFEALL